MRDAIARITEAHPLIAEGRQVVIARNREYVGVDEPLADGDELAPSRRSQAETRARSRRSP